MLNIKIKILNYIIITNININNKILIYNSSKVLGSLEI